MKVPDFWTWDSVPPGVWVKFHCKPEDEYEEYITKDYTFEEYGQERVERGCNFNAVSISTDGWRCVIIDDGEGPFDKADVVEFKFKKV